VALIPGWLADLLGVRAAVDAANVEYPQRRLWRFIGGVTIADNPALGTTDISAGGSLGFRGEFYVDPTFTGQELGSSSSPFRTFAACFAYAASIGVVHGKIWTNSVTENIALPLTGDWEISGTVAVGNLAVAVITGNVLCSASVSCRRTFTNLQITGALTGNAGSGAQSMRVMLDTASVQGAVALTVSGGGIVRLGSRGGASAGILAAANLAYTFFNGPVSVAGTVWADTAIFSSTLQCSGRCAFSSCRFAGNITATSIAALDDDTSLVFTSCIVNSISVSVTQSVAGKLALIAATDCTFDDSTFSFSGAGLRVFNLDDATAQTFFQHGASVSGATTNGVGTMARQRRTAQTGNVGASVVGFKSPVAQLRVTATLTLVTPGTLGSAVLSITYVDSLGVTRTKPVTSALNIAGAAGDEASGSLVFTQDGSASVQYSISGITTAGALSYNFAVSVQPAM
jgi:hypothetical protein